MTTSNWPVAIRLSVTLFVFMVTIVFMGFIASVCLQYGIPVIRSSLAYFLSVMNGSPFVPGDTGLTLDYTAVSFLFFTFDFCVGYMAYLTLRHQPKPEALIRLVKVDSL